MESTHKKGWALSFDTINIKTTKKFEQKRFGQYTLPDQYTYNYIQQYLEKPIRQYKKN